MKKSSIRLKSFLTGLLCLMAVTIVQTTDVEARKANVTLTDKIQQVPARSALYDMDIQPLAMEKCAQCHIGVYTRLKEKGVRHQKDCTFCHEVYHSFAPGKLEYAEAIPKCQTCHGTPHGTTELVSTCNNCHSNAHSPVDLPNITGDMCINCHAGPPQALIDFPSKHTNVACTDCHTSHGFIPNCTTCHSTGGGEPFHMAGEQTNKTCLDCHTNPHTPLKISYPEDTPQTSCGTCHKNPSHARVFETIKKANSKHNTEVTCASCHDQHGLIPDCSKCHDADGHRAGLDTSACLRCHSNPHDPMTIGFDIDEPKKVCGGCHTEVYDTLMTSNTRHTNQTCAFCHPRHGEIPSCQKCHGVPHGEAMLQQFGGSCGGCHSIAHKIEGKMKDNVEGSLTEEGRKGVLTTVK